MPNENQDAVDSVVDMDEENQDVQDLDNADDSPQGQKEASDGQDSQSATDEDELIVTIEGAEQDEEEAKAPNWVKELRKKNREDQRRIRELEERLAQGSAPQSDDPGKEPELEDFEYDTDQFKAAYREWTAKKASVEQQREAIRRQQEEAAKEWETVQQGYVKAKARFPAAKMQEAEDEVVSVLPGPRQAMLMDVADDSAQLVMALGSNPETLRKLASIKSDAKFIKELTKLEGKITVKSKNTPPPPERMLSGSGKTPGASANNLEALKDRAEKSGDWTAYLAAKRKAGK